MLGPVAASVASFKYITVLMNVCRRLFLLCQVIRDENDYRSAVEFDATLLRELEHLLNELSDDDISLVGAESASYYYEAIGNIPAAIEAQRKLLERIDLCRKHIDENNFDEDVLQVLLERCDDEERNRCVSVIERLERER